jgi:hypothetical protein
VDSFPQVTLVSCPCCRPGRTAATSAGPCAWIEQGGANYVVYPVVTTAGLQITMSSDPNLPRIDLTSLLAANKCSGPTCRWLQRELPLIYAAALKSPATFSRYSRSGLGLSELVRLAHSVGK